MICYYLYQLTFPEIQAIRAKKNGEKSVTSIQGELLTDHSDRSLWGRWQKEIQDVSKGVYTSHKVPQPAMDFFQSTKFLSSPPTEEVVITSRGKTLNLVKEDIQDAVIITPEQKTAVKVANVLNSFKPPRFTWSLTSLQDFENCPLCFAEKRFYKRFKDTPFNAQDWGNRLHTTAEHYAKALRDEKPQTFEPELLDIVKPYCDAIVASSKGGVLHIEHDLAFTEKFEPCSPTDWDRVWYRGKSDVSLIKAAATGIKTCYVYDFKSGKVKDDPTQLNLMCACEALLDQSIQKFEGRYIWLKNKTVSAPVLLDRKDLVAIWRDILARVARMRQAWDSQIFQARSSGLCKQYCPVTTCAHCGRK